MKCYRCGIHKAPGPCDNCGASGSTYRLSNMDIDEVSFVPRGANQQAHIVLHKSEDQVPTGTKLWDLLAVARELQDANPGLNVAQAISKALEGDPGLYDPDMRPWTPPEPIQKSGLSFELEAAAERMQEANPTWTFAKCGRGPACRPQPVPVSKKSSGRAARRLAQREATRRDGKE